MNVQLILLGAVLAAPYVALTEWVGGKLRTPLYGVGLVVGGVIYVGLATVAGAGD